MFLWKLGSISVKFYWDINCATLRVTETFCHGAADTHDCKTRRATLLRVAESMCFIKAITSHS